MDTTDRILSSLLDRLWRHYCDRVEYARRYVELVEANGGRVVNDHIAFRTLNTATGTQPPGIAAVERVFVPLGYLRADTYTFPDKHLTAWHYRHSDPTRPKIFISQLEVDQLPPTAVKMISAAVADAVDHFSDESRAMLTRAGDPSPDQVDRLVEDLFDFFTVLPWPPPVIDTVETLNKTSQYAAWTLLHANNVNHFTAYINEQKVGNWPDIDATVAALRSAGVPMKPTVEGAPGSKLRQSATQAVDVECPVRKADGSPATLRWTYAYYELAERGMVADEAGKLVRFEGFLGPQATHLFDMTKRT